MDKSQNLPLDLQGVFDVVWERAKNKVAAMNEREECCYRTTHNGEPIACFLGVCIPDSLYDPRMEMKDANTLAEQFPVQFIKVFGDTDPEYLRDMQRIHDFKDPSEWDHSLRCFANAYELTIPE